VKSINLGAKIKANLARKVKKSQETRQMDANGCKWMQMVRNKKGRIDA